jgi:hypothetical protein
MTEETKKPEENKEPEKANNEKKKKTPWKPASVLHVPERYLNKNFVYRWVTKSKPGNMQKKSFEGWEVDTELMKKLQADGVIPISTINDGKPVDKTVYAMREMVLMRLPRETAKEREDYYRDKAHSAQEDAQEKYNEQIKGLAPGGGARGYGKVKYKRLI